MTEETLEETTKEDVVIPSEEPASPTPEKDENVVDGLPVGEDSDSSDPLKDGTVGEGVSETTQE